MILEVLDITTIDEHTPGMPACGEKQRHFVQIRTKRGQVEVKEQRRKAGKLAACCMQSCTKLNLSFAAGAFTAMGTCPSRRYSKLATAKPQPDITHGQTVGLQVLSEKSGTAYLRLW